MTWISRNGKLKFIDKSTYVETNDKYGAVSELAKNENNDCVVRAVASGFGLTYEVAHEFCKTTLSRPDKKGVKGTSHQFINLIKDGFKLNGKTLQHVYSDYIKNSVNVYYAFRKPSLAEKKDRAIVELEKHNMPTAPQYVKLHTGSRITVNRILRNLTTGTYLIHVNSHYFTIKDGVVLGNFKDVVRRSRQVNHVFRIN